ncbi:MAG: hypothetical protein DI601_08190 [Azospirillum brasilense]|uniref:hypothetical protein n=1 Tax=Roseomonas gilardii TaxID=257708 RepID=UPI000DAF7834|nr:hypothetical protein [Roseomonas gilardii]PZP45901.1 MAG: hypothetical protein DI601_08190 [Azospirillum brasilense]
MAGNRQGAPQAPERQALARLAELAGKGAAPDRVRREVETIVEDWRRGVLGYDERAALRERLEEMHGQLAEGVESVEEQMAEIGQDERAALVAGRRSLAALVAARDALARAHSALLPA